MRQYIQFKGRSAKPCGHRNRAQARAKSKRFVIPSRRKSLHNVGSAAVAAIRPRASGQPDRGRPEPIPGTDVPPPAAMDQPKRILIVEDDADIADVLSLHLRDERYEVVHSADGAEGLRLLEQGGWDALILDLMLPGVDGLEICRRARAMTRYTPIIITSARSSEVHRILGLELGADDYLAKPFSVLELVARVKALLRRVDALARDSRIDAGTLDVAGLAIDPIAREASVDGARIDLTPREFDLLYFFARHPGKVFSRMDLLNAVWGYQHEGYEHTVNTHINRLRAKIEADPAEPVRILTVWGRGYKLAAPGQRDA